MIVNIDKYEEVYSVLKKYLTDPETNPYNPSVTKLYKATIDKKKFPLITIEEITNTLSQRTLGGNESISTVVYEINIYAINKIINKEEVGNMTIARQLSALVDNVLGEHFRMRRIYNSPTPNIDTTIYRITMRYEKNLFDNRGKFIN